MKSVAFLSRGRRWGRLQSILFLKACGGGRKGPPAAVLEDLPGHQFQGQDDQGGDDDYVIQVAQPGEEVGDKVNGREGVAYRES